MLAVLLVHLVRFSSLRMEVAEIEKQLEEKEVLLLQRRLETPGTMKRFDHR